ncbi:MAG TPA: hypothetical protein DCW83_03265 [Saprospirales bacterium]|jgi:hypothetical protein|nr:hypothetical protein [Saprospirales bacterium]
MPNFLNPSSFVMTLDSQTYSGAQFTVQTMMLPDVSAEGAPVTFKQVNVAMAADKVMFAPLELSYLIDEDLLNYKEIFDWMKMGIETNHQQAIIGNNHVRDLTLTVMNSANNVTKQINFIDAYPTSLSSLPFDITTTDVEYLTAVATFNYSYYEFI